MKCSPLTLRGNDKVKDKIGSNWLPVRGKRKCSKNKQKSRFRKERARVPNTNLAYFVILGSTIVMVFREYSP